MVELVTVSVPALKMPPPLSSRPSCWSMVELVTVSVPPLLMPPPSVGGRVVVDGGVGDRQRATVADAAAEAAEAPPLKLSAMVELVTASVPAL